MVFLIKKKLKTVQTLMIQILTVTVLTMEKKKKRKLTPIILILMVMELMTMRTISQEILMKTRILTEVELETILIQTMTMMEYLMRKK